MNPYELELELRKRRVENVDELPEVVRNRMNATYEILSDIPMKRNIQARRSKVIIQYTLVAASITVLLASSILAMGFVSPVMAESLKQIPIVNSVFNLAGDLGLKAADEKGLASNVNLSDSHDGVTLNVPQIIYDGIRVSIALNSNVNVMDTMENLEILIDHKSVSHKDEWGPIPGISVQPGIDEYSAIMEFSDPSNSGMGAGVFPDQFVLTLRTNMKGSEAPFEIDIPVTKNTKDVKVITPGVKRTHDNLIVTLDKVRLTPITTGLSMTIDATAANIPMKYQPYLPGSYVVGMSFTVIDDQGNDLEWVGGAGNNNAARDITIEDIQVSPVLSTAKSITIKPYIDLTVDDNIAEMMSQGERMKEYIKELEITVPISQ